MSAARKWRNKTFRIEDAVLRRAEERARAEGRTLQQVVRLDLERYARKQDEDPVAAFLRDADEAVARMPRREAPYVFDRNALHRQFDER